MPRRGSRADCVDIYLSQKNPPSGAADSKSQGGSVQMINGRDVIPKAVECDGKQTGCRFCKPGFWSWLHHFVMKIRRTHL